MVRQILDSVLHPQEPRCLCDTRLIEDIPGLAAESFALAQSGCRLCGEVHAVWPYIRLARASTGIESRASGLEAMLANRVGAERRSILIAGAADTGLLALVARAFGPNANIAVFDRCDVPLELCRRFARRWCLSIDTLCVDLADMEIADRFDLVIVHGTLQFIAGSHRPQVVSRLARSLRPDGQLLLLFNASQPIVDGLREEHRRDYAAHVIAELDRLQIPLPEQRAAFSARLTAHAQQRESREGAFSSPQEAELLLNAAGLTIEHRRQIQLALTPPARRFVAKISKQRHLVLARRSGKS